MRYGDEEGATDMEGYGAGVRFQRRRWRKKKKRNVGGCWCIRCVANRLVSVDVVMGMMDIAKLVEK